MVNKQNTRLFILILIGISISIVSTSLFSYYKKQELLHEFVGMKFVVESESNLHALLFFTYSEKFDEPIKLNNLSEAKDTLLYNFPKSDQLVKKFRLDFGNIPRNDNVKIKEVHLLFDNQSIVVNEEEFFSKIDKNSSAIGLDKKKRILFFKKDTKPFDPYIIFTPLGELVMQKSSYSIVLILPFLVLLLLFKRHYLSKGTLDFLVLLFIFCIPLKIAWTTFITILLCLFGLLSTFLKKKNNIKNTTSYVFVGMFLLLIVFGQPDSFSLIEKQLSYLMFALIGVTLSFSKFKIYKYYVLFMLVLNAIMVVSAISFLLWFNDFYALDTINYFEDIKKYDGNVRKWFYYNHAAFLSFFGLIGVLFSHKLYDRKELDIKLLSLYHVFLVLFIILVGTRICLLIYVVFLFNLVVKLNNKKRIFINTTFFAVFALLLVFYIQEADVNRYRLWSISWEAIKEKPFFGFGLGQSNNILHNEVFIDRAGFSVPYRLNHSHNQFLTFLLEIGSIGALVMFGTFILFLSKTKMYRDVTFLLFILGLGYLFMTESVLQTSKPLYVISFLFLIITSKDFLNDTKFNSD